MDSVLKSLHSPVFNLTAVLRETGLKADVLRAWERRYDLPKPQRTPGGHRLYSQYDIDTIKWLRARQAEGLTISRAVNLWNESVRFGNDPLALPPSPANDSPAVEININELRNEWVAACLDFDSSRVEKILDQAFSVFPLTDIVTEILQEGLRVIGSRWEAGTATVQQEHFTSAVVIQKLEALIANLPEPIRNQSVLIACPTGEWHTIPALLINLHLRQRGYKVTYLGANTPADQLLQTVKQIEPNIVVLSAQRLVTAAALKNTVIELNKYSVPIAYGGLIFNRNQKLREFISAAFLGTSILESVDQIELMVISKGTPQVKSGPADQNSSLSAIFTENRPRIELSVLNNMQAAGYKVSLISEGNRYFGDYLQAALDLGNISLLETDLDWFKYNLGPRVSASNTLRDFLRFWGDQLEIELGKQGHELNDWLKSFALTIEKFSSN